MLDHPSSFSEITVPRGPARTAPPKRRRSRAPGAFVGVDLIVGWDGPSRELVQSLRHTGLKRLFVLRSVACGTRFIWRAEDSGTSLGKSDLSGHGPWKVRFDATREAGNRAEAHLPRLLESIGSRMTWQQVEKRHDVPVASMDELGEWSSRSAPNQMKGDAA